MKYLAPILFASLLALTACQSPSETPVVASESLASAPVPEPAPSNVVVVPAPTLSPVPIPSPSPTVSVTPSPSPSPSASPVQVLTFYLDGDSDPIVNEHVCDAFITWNSAAQTIKVRDANDLRFTIYSAAGVFTQDTPSDPLVLVEHETFQYGGNIFLHCSYTVQNGQIVSSYNQFQNP